MRIVTHDLAVLAGAGLRFVGIDHKVVGPLAHLLGHERPLEAGREAGAAPPPQARCLDLVDDPVVALFDERLCAVPGAAAAGAFKAPVIEAIEVLEDAVLVFEHKRLRSSSPLLPAIGVALSPSRGHRLSRTIFFAINLRCEQS